MERRSLLTLLSLPALWPLAAWARPTTGGGFGEAAHYGLSRSASGAVNSAAIQAAIDAGHKHIVIPAGAFRLAKTITAPEGVTLSGMGMAATVLNCATGLSPFIFTRQRPAPGNTGGGMRDLGLNLDGDDVVGVTLKNQWGFSFHRVRFFGNPIAKAVLAHDASYEVLVSHCRIERGTVAGLHFADDSNSSMVEYCDFAPGHNGAAILAEGIGGLVVQGNRFEFAADYGGVHLDINGCSGTLITGNHIGANSNGGENVANIRLRGGTRNTSIVGNRISSDIGMSGVMITGAGTAGVTVVGNTFEVDGGDAAIAIDGASRVTLVGNTFAVNYSTTAVISLTNSSSNIRIADNSIAATAGFVGSGKTATGLHIAAGCAAITVQSNDIEYLSRGIVCEANNSTPSCAILDNMLETNVIPMSVAVPASVRVVGNKGFITENRGAAAIPDGATSVEVAHGLALVPPVAGISITPTNNPTNDPGNFWVGSVGATTFTVNCRANPGPATAAFAWSARVND